MEQAEPNGTAVIADYMRQRARLTERIIELSASAQWNHYATAKAGVTAEIERIDRIVASLLGPQPQPA